MPEKERIVSFRDLLRGTLAWIVSAAVLLLGASILFTADLVRLPGLGYASSLISFLAAAAAGACTSSPRRGKRLLASLLMGAALSGVLLLFGFLIAGELDPGAVISVVSFTLSGCLAGAFLPKKSKAKRAGRRSRRFT